MILKDHEVLLKKVLEAGLSENIGKPVVIFAIHREPSNPITSYNIEILKVELQDGEEIKIFFKDFEHSRLPKDGMERRREREMRSYRELLRRAGLGTPRYYGALWDASKNHFWLFLEYVGGELLRNREFDDWVKAAAWLGRMQGYFSSHLDLVKTCDYLVQHEADFYQLKAKLALQSVTQFSHDLAERLGRIIEDYYQHVDRLVELPRTFVHGSYRPQNILVASRGEDVRICPVDWELAAYGSRLYDLAFLSDGFHPPKLYILWDAYRQEASRHGIDAPENEEMRYLIDCFRLHKVLKSLSESRSWNFPEETVARLVGIAEELGRAIGGN